MRRFLLVSLAALSVLIALIPACKAGQIKANLGDEVQLRPGQQVTVSGENLSIEFVKVKEDSRCPTGVM